MADQEVRLGGMALANGVLVHGPNSWGCAVRLSDGRLKVLADYKRYRASSVTNPLLRGPARLAEVLALVPHVRRRMPEAKLPFERPRVLTAMVASAGVVQVARGSARLSPAGQELIGAVASLVPAVFALRSDDLAAYHGAEHIAIGSHEHGEAREKEHERCGSHLVGPLLITTAIGNVLAARAPVHLRSVARTLAGIGALAASTALSAFRLTRRCPRAPQAVHGRRAQCDQHGPGEPRAVCGVRRPARPASPAGRGAGEAAA